MDTRNWKDKILILENFESTSEQLSGNSMGIYVERNAENGLLVHFKPLNEDFKDKVFSNNPGTLLNFERDLIDEDDIEYALDVMFLFNRYPQFSLRKNDEVRQLYKLLDLLKEEYYNAAASYVMLKTLLKVLLLHLIRYQNDGFLRQDLHQKRVFRFLELMEANFLQETNAAFYAQELGISVKRLNQILKEKLQMTAKQIIQQRQVTEAKRMLVKSEISVKELAFELGFDSMSSFSRFFKKNVGVNPSEFKLRH